MEQFRQVGEVLGSMKALMVLQDEIQINRRQCCLLLDVFTMAFTVIASEITHNLRLEERSTKWKPLEEPLRQVHRVFKEGEMYIRYCLDSKDWWAKAVILHQNKDCIEYHIHNLLSNFPVVIESIESAGEISGLDTEEIQRKGVLLRKKYDKEWNDRKLFQLRYGEEYLVSKELSMRLDTAWKEDRWLLQESLRAKRRSETLSKLEKQLADYLLEKLSSGDPFHWMLFNSTTLTGATDYQVRHRLGGGDQFKDIDWLGGTFIMRHLRGGIEKSKEQISTVLSLSHPNILQYLACFYGKEDDECFMIMEWMSNTLGSYVKEKANPSKRILLPLMVVVDIMLQIARGMEYLHSQKVYHGNLNPSNVFVKTRTSPEGHIRVKVSGFGFPSDAVNGSSNAQSSLCEDSTNPFIWYGPEILAVPEQRQGIYKYTENADVYSFGMICFQLMTGKIPFEDSHLQGDRVVQNILAGERPLFSLPSPKYLVSLTKRCWQAEPSLRPKFSSICRILRYVKKFLAMNPNSDHHPELQSPPVDYWHVEAMLQREEEMNGNYVEVSPVLEIPFQMFACKLAEAKQLRNAALSLNMASCDVSSVHKDETMQILDHRVASAADTSLVCLDSQDKSKKGAKSIGRAPRDDDPVLSVSGARSICSEAPGRTLAAPKKLDAILPRKNTGSPKAVYQKLSPLSPRSRTLKTTINKKSDASMVSPLKGGRARLSERLPDNKVP